MLRITWPIIRLILMWLFVTGVLILVVLLPRGIANIDYTKSKVEIEEAYKENITTFSWEAYKQNITSTYTYVQEHKSLG